MFIKILGKYHQLNDIKRNKEPTYRDSPLSEILQKDLGITEKAIIAILEDPLIGDKHTATAAVLYRKPEHAVTSQEREVAKQRNFLILYGANDI